MMSVREQVEKTLSEKHINYFKGSGTSDNIFSLPYRGINNEKDHVIVYMEVIEDIRTIRFTLIEKANRDKAISSVQSDLLDLSSKLNFGNLSMQSDSDTIEYRIEYQLDVGTEFSYNTYNVFIVRCLNVFDELRERDLI